MTKVTHLALDEAGGGLNRRRIHLREISGDADAPLETVGQDLRAARLRRGDDLATVSRILKIRKDHLEAIEEDRLDALPGRTYAIGFVRTYSDHLGLDPVQCVERFKAEIAGRGETATPVIMTSDPGETRLPHGWLIIALVVLGLIGYGAYHLAISADSILRPPVGTVPNQFASRPVTPPIRKAVIAKVLPAETLAPKPAQPVATSAVAPTAIEPPVAAPTPSSPSQILAALPAGQVYGEFNHNARVVLKVREATKVLVQDASGKIFINRTLEPGDSYQVPDMVGLTLSTPNGGAVGLELDGQAMGFAGQDGKMTDAMSLDPQSIVDHFSGSPN